MSKPPILVTAPTDEPLDLDEVKAHLRVDHTAEDDTIYGLIIAAREQVETDTGRALVTQTLDQYLDGWPCGGVIELPRPVLQSVTSVTYYDQDDAATVWASTNYRVDPYRWRGRVVLRDGVSWPSTTLREVNGIKIRFVAGYGAPAAVPERLLQAMKLLIGHWYENREAASSVPGVNVVEIPLGYRRLVAPFDARRK